VLGYGGGNFILGRNGRKVMEQAKILVINDVLGYGIFFPPTWGLSREPWSKKITVCQKSLTNYLSLLMNNNNFV
jgi:hypothetical protein